MPLRSPPGRPQLWREGRARLLVGGSRGLTKPWCHLELFSEFAKQTFSPGDKIVERSGEGFPWREQLPSQHLEPRGAQARSHGAPRQPYHFQMGHFLRILGFSEKYFSLKEPEACMSVMQPWRPRPRVMRASAVLLCGLPAAGTALRNGLLTCVCPAASASISA